VINVSGHRLGTAEIESALVAHKACAEAAVVGAPDELTGCVAEAAAAWTDGGEWRKERMPVPVCLCLFLCLILCLFLYHCASTEGLAVAMTDRRHVGRGALT
jgi:acyl-CoA synthetase (AMP-forming)/AMP-acid ligase II